MHKTGNGMVFHACSVPVITIFVFRCEIRLSSVILDLKAQKMSGLQHQISLLEGESVAVSECFQSVD